MSMRNRLAQIRARLLRGEISTKEGAERVRVVIGGEVSMHDMARVYGTTYSAGATSTVNLPWTSTLAKKTLRDRLTGVSVVPTWWYLALLACFAIGLVEGAAWVLSR